MMEIKPIPNLKVIASFSIKYPSKMADSGLKPREIAACVGEISCKAFPQQNIIKTPPGITNMKKAMISF